MGTDLTYTFRHNPFDWSYLPAVLGEGGLSGVRWQKVKLRGSGLPLYSPYDFNKLFQLEG